MRKPLLVVMWLVATVATTAVAYVAVNAAGAEVTDRPLTSIVATGDTNASSNTSTTTSLAAGASVPSTSSTTSTNIGPTTNGSTTSGPGTTATTGGTTAPGTSTTSPTSTTVTASTSTSSTATTASAAPWQQTTIPSKGGLVIVSYRPGEVKLESVAPTAGFTYEIDDQGPSEVRVKFEGGDVKVEVRVRWDDGLVTEVDEDS